MSHSNKSQLSILESMEPEITSWALLSKLRGTLSEFLYMTEKEVLKRFACLPQAQNTGMYCYVPGTRKDRVLLVAHSDTVWSRPPEDVKWLGNFGMSMARTYKRVDIKTGKEKYITEHDGLGADDRCGVAMLWALRNLGHSLLITTGEESGCLGAYRAGFDMPKELAKHQFMVEIDRRGDREYVFYDVASKEFSEWWAKQCGDEWDCGYGTFTDITVLADCGICGVNMAAGYLFEHTAREIISLDAWLRTKRKLQDILSQQDIPRFELLDYNSSWGTWYGHGTHLGWDDRWSDWEDIDGAEDFSSAGTRKGTAALSPLCGMCGLDRENDCDCRATDRETGEVYCIYCGENVEDCQCERATGVCINCGSVMSNCLCDEGDADHLPPGPLVCMNCNLYFHECQCGKEKLQPLDSEGAE